jgi:hypothetical protein
MERNYPLLYIYSQGDDGGSDAVKARITFSRERKGPQDRDEPDWICKMVCVLLLWFRISTDRSSAISTTMPQELDASAVKPQKLVCMPIDLRDSL